MILLLDYSDVKEVREQIRWWQKHPSSLERYFKNSAPYIYYVYKETKEYCLPTEFTLLPVLESGYTPLDYSYAGANGLWQIMPGTASGFGLKIDWWYDGRRDVVASTHAALKYLKYLYSYFGDDWLSAAAGYNAGEGTIRNAIHHNSRRNLPTDFWSLNLPKETTYYVPRFLALASIIRDPEKYGITLPKIEDRPYFKMVDIGSQIDLNQAAILADVNFETITKLNPAFRRLASPPNGPHTLLLPINKADIFTERLKVLSDTERVTWREHVVKQGETIVTLAKEFKVNVALLRKANDLKKPNIKPKEIILVPFNYDNENFDLDSLPKVKAATAEEVLPGPQRWMHKVKPNETFKTIANKYHIANPYDIAFWNHLNIKETLPVDDEILVWVSPKTFKELQTPPAAPIKYRIYKVKKRDTIFSLARRFKVSVAILKQDNKLTNNQLKLGQCIKIRQPVVVKKTKIIKNKVNKKNNNNKHHNLKHHKKHV